MSNLFQGESLVGAERSFKWVLSYDELMFLNRLNKQKEATKKSQKAHNPTKNPNPQPSPSTKQTKTPNQTENPTKKPQAKTFARRGSADVNVYY